MGTLNQLITDINQKFNVSAKVDSMWGKNEECYNIDCDKYFCLTINLDKFSWFFEPRINLDELISLAEIAPHDEVEVEDAEVWGKRGKSSL